VHCLLGLPFDALDMATAVEQVRGALAERRPCFISTPNLNFLIGSRTDTGFRDSIITSDLSIADGMPLIWVARILGIPLRERVAGSELFERLKGERSRPLKVYFFGGQPGVAERAARRLNAEANGLECVGYESPGFGSLDELSRDDTIARINASDADLLVVALGAKKGQAWIEHNRARITVPAMTHLGAVINFVAGTVQRAPSWMQRVGLEWLWRIKEEPALWRRYFSDGLKFVSLLATRVAPYAWLIYRHKPANAELTRATVDIHQVGGELYIRPRGAWCSQNMHVLRERLSAAAAGGRHIRVNLAQVSYVDSAFLGLLLVLYGMQKKQGRRLICGAATPTVRKIFRYGCSEFLLAPDDDAAWDTAAAALDEVEAEDAGTNVGR
jgi:N-acetylglucosaminyldiphosphoundecaprenol N-acetyl-beta-D-mannosaminyltransferase